ncbi:MAG: hypothetical protein WEG40_21070 [Candidatus Rokuibacteriota bacterium]
MTRPRPGLSALKARLDDLVAGARRAFLEEGSHPVTACIYLPGGTPLRFEAPSGSPENLAIIRQLFEIAARGGAEACAVVSEGWSVQGVERALAWKKRGRSLAEAPGRSEILIVAIASPAGLLDHRLRIRRAGARVTLEDLGANTMTVSRFLTDLPWPVRPTRKRP